MAISRMKLPHVPNKGDLVIICTVLSGTSLVFRHNSEQES